MTQTRKKMIWFKWADDYKTKKQAEWVAKYYKMKKYKVYKLSNGKWVLEEKIKVKS